jgi:Zn-dependent protease
MEGIWNWPPNLAMLLYLPGLFIGFTVHELAHAVVAYLLGDTSQVERKRLSFNPLRHVSWLGLVIFLMFGFGWAKPVWVDASRFRIRNRSLGMFLVSIAGASANLLVALVALVGLMGTALFVSLATGSTLWEVIRYLTVQELKLDLQGLAVALSTYVMSVNLILAVFNLFPLPPLDGFQALTSLANVIRGALRRKQGENAAARSPVVTRPSVLGKPFAMAPAGEQAPGELHPSQIHFNIALDYHKQGQWDEAIARYRQALAHDAQMGLAYYNLGLAYLAKGRPPLATSAFKAAMQSSRDVGVRLQADLRLRELARVEQDPAAALELVPPPLEPGSVPESLPQEPPRPLDPVVARRVWLRLGIGGILVLVSTVVVWLFVTGVAWNALM